jgi:hypothetical protein
MNMPLLYKNKRAIMFAFYSIAIFIVSMAVLIPWYPDFIQTAGGDDSYAYIYHEIFAGKANCGNDLYCHHGPLGLWYWPIYHLNTYWTLIISHIYVAITIVIVASNIVFHKIKSYIIRVFYMLAIIGLLSVDMDARIFLANILFLTIFPRYLDKNKSFCILLLLSVIAFSFFVKSTFILFGFVSVIGASFVEVIRCRRFPRVFLWYLVFLIIFSIVSGMSVLSVPQHVIRTFDFASGYTDIYSEYGGYFELIIFIILVSIFMTLVVKNKKLDNSLVSWIYIVCYFVLVFLIYKASFTRPDGQHILHGYVSIVTSIALYVAQNFNIFERNDTTRNKNFTISMVLLLVVGLLVFLYKNPTIYQGKFKKLYVNISTAASVLFMDNPLVELHNIAKQKIVSEYPIDSVDGSVMLLDKRQTIGIANNIDLQLIPTIASEIAFNRKSAMLNYRLFSTNRAPDYLLVSNFNSLFPGQIILEIIQNYAFDGYNNDFVQLRKIPKSQVDIIFSKGDDFNLNINEIINFNKIDSLLWAKFDVNKTVFGKFIEFFYKIPKLYIEVEKMDGSKEKKYVSVDMLKGGIILSYIGENIRDIFDENNHNNNALIKSFSLKSEGIFTPFFDSVITVNIANINILDNGN